MSKEAWRSPDASPDTRNIFKGVKVRFVGIIEVVAIV